MSNSKHIESFIQEYTDKLNKLRNQLDTCTDAIEKLQLEIRYVTDKELPEAIEKRVIDGDSLLENKLRKDLDKLTKQLQSKQEEATVLTNVIEKFKIKQAEEASNLSKAFYTERKVAEDAAYSKMMHAKNAYIQALLQEGETLQAYHRLDSQLQSIQVAGGRKSGVYSELTVKSAPSPSEASSHSGIYLPLSMQEVKRLITGSYNAYDTAYLKPFTHKKGL